MTILPVPARVPVLSMRARFIFVPGLSDGYQDRICFTRSVRRMAVLRSSLEASNVKRVLHAPPGACHLFTGSARTPAEHSAQRSGLRTGRSVLLVLRLVYRRRDEARPGLGVADPAAEEGGPAQDRR